MKLFIIRLHSYFIIFILLAHFLSYFCLLMFYFYVIFKQVVHISSQHADLITVFDQF